jgi:anti-sigma regulatory factor (Ser/Thr protein kinase)
VAPRANTSNPPLFDNAAKHGGNTPSVEVEVTETDGQILIVITDDGPGIPEGEPGGTVDRCKYNSFTGIRE